MINLHTLNNSFFGDTIILQLLHKTTYKILQHTKTLRDYTMIGLLATATHYGILIFLVDLLRILDPVRASTIGFLSGAVLSFVLNNRLVFKQQAIRFAAVVRYILLVCSNSIANTMFMYMLVNLIDIQYLLAQIMVTAVLYISNFILCKLWVFNERSYAEQS